MKKIRNYIGLFLLIWTILAVLTKICLAMTAVFA